MIVEEFVATLGIEFVGESGLEKAKHAIESFKGGILGAIGVFGGVAAGLSGIGVAVAKQVDELSDFGDAVGLTVQTLQTLGLAGAEVGLSSEKMQAGFQRLTGAMQEAAAGGEGPAAKAFARLGVSATDSRGQLKSLESALPQLAEGFKRIQNPTERAALAADLFGRGGARWVPLLSKGAAGFEEMRERAEAFGVVLDKETVEQFSKFSDLIDVFGQQIKGQFANPIAKVVVPLLLKSLQSLSDFLLRHKRDIDEFFSNRLADAIGGTVRVVRSLLDAFAETKQILDSVSPAILKIIGIFVLLAAAFLSPIVALGVLAFLIGVIAEDFEKFSKGAPSLIGEVVKSWDKFKEALGEEIDAPSIPIFKFWKNLALVVGDVARLALSVMTMDFTGMKDALSDLALDSSRVIKQTTGSTPGELAKSAVSGVFGAPPETFNAGEMPVWQPPSLWDRVTGGSNNMEQTVNINIAGNADANTVEKFRMVAQDEFRFGVESATTDRKAH